MDDEVKEAMAEETSEMQATMKEALGESTLEQPKEITTEGTPEVKQEIKPTEKIETEEVKKVELPKVETLKVEPPKQHTVPLSKFITLEKELKALKKEAKTPEAKQELESDIDALLENYNLDEEGKELFKALDQRTQSSLKELKEYKEKDKQAKEQDEADKYLTSKADELDLIIKEEHSDMSSAELMVIKSKIINKAKEKGILDLEMIFRGTPEFRAKQRIVTAESSNQTIKTKPKVIDLNNIKTNEELEALTDDQTMEFLEKNS